MFRFFVIVVVLLLSGFGSGIGLDGLVLFIPFFVIVVVYTSTVPRCTFFFAIVFPKFSLAYTPFTNSRLHPPTCYFLLHFLCDGFGFISYTLLVNVVVGMSGCPPDVQVYNARYPVRTWEGGGVHVIV